MHSNGEREQAIAEPATEAELTAFFLSVDDVARRTGLTHQNVLRHVYRGQLPARRWGQKVVFSEAELRAFFDNLPRHGGAGTSGRKRRR